MADETPAMRWYVAGAVLIAALALTIAIPLIGGEPSDRVASRPVPPSAAAPPASATAAVPTDAPAAPLSWTVPAGWTPAPLKEMRIAVFTVALGEATGECGVFLMPGGGDRLANVNRWRGQAGLPPLDEAGLGQALSSDTCALGPFAWLPITGPGKSFLAATVPTPSGQCFVKLEAPAAAIDRARDGFLAFCRSLAPGRTP